MSHHLKFAGNLSTTAMGILPHRDVASAMALALSVDIPFWPQLPRLDFREDMYIQAMEGFPGAVFDEEGGRVFVSTERFMEEVPGYLEMEGTGYWIAGESFLEVYRSFLDRELSGFKAIHGQIISPVSLALKIVDENGRPIVYNDDIRSIVFSFIQGKLNRQYRGLAGRNEHAFVWIDDPGLEFIFNALCGYDAVKAREELGRFFDGVQGPRGLHLCGRPDWDFLLTMNIEVLSLNAYAHGDTFVSYDRVGRFLEEGNIISWGIVPTYYEELPAETVRGLADRLERMWAILEKRGVSKETIVRNSLLAPATCNLLNPDGAVTADSAFRLLAELSAYLKERYRA
jgi:hypothetical protein